MKHRTSPCSDCPYRMDVTLGYWHRDHYEAVLVSERNDGPVNRSLFDCHKESDKPKGERSFCAGWLNDQKKNGVPNNLSVRIKLMTNQEFIDAFGAVGDGGNEMWENAIEMCLANLEAMT